MHLLARWALCFAGFMLLGSCSEDPSGDPQVPSSASCESCKVLRAENVAQEKRYQAEMTSLVDELRKLESDNTESAADRVSGQTHLERAQEEIERLRRKLSEVPASHWISQLQGDPGEGTCYFAIDQIAQFHANERETMDTLMPMLSSWQGKKHQWALDGLEYGWRQPTFREPLIAHVESSSNPETVKLFIKLLSKLGWYKARDVIPRLEKLTLHAEIPDAIKTEYRDVVESMKK